jgi:hypothetical protein
LKNFKSLIKSPSKVKIVTEEIPVDIQISYYFTIQQKILFSRSDPSSQSSKVIMNCPKGKIILKGPKTEVEKFKKELMEKIKQVKVIELNRKFPEHFARRYIKHPRIQQIIGTEVVVFFPFKQYQTDVQESGPGPDQNIKNIRSPHVHKVREKVVHVNNRFTT